MCSKVVTDGLDDEKLKDLTVTNDCERDRFTGKDACILGGTMGWATRKGDRRDENAERILIQMTHRILIDNTATYQYRNTVKPFTNLMEGGFMPGTITKADIIAAIQTENGYSLQKSADTVETLIEIIKRTLETGEDVLISGYGKFCVKDKRERRGRNPATDEDMALPARRVVAFKCSGKLRDRINDSYGEKL